MKTKRGMTGKVLALCVMIAMLAIGQAVHATVTVETVTVGNPDNAADNTGLGSVGYVYQIGKYEITNGQYVAFLNAVATVGDPYGLYDTRMNGFSGSCGIIRSGAGTAANPYSYSFASYSVPNYPVNSANFPVNWVYWDDAARFCNWLHNGQPTGVEDMTTTEDGSYTLNGAVLTGDWDPYTEPNPGATLAIKRNPNATWVIPSDNEWYKAAYHKNNGVTGDYYTYPTSSDTVPSKVWADPLNPANDPGNNATFMLNHPFLNKTNPNEPRTTPVGAHGNTTSPYGAFDMGGNLSEWVDEVDYYDFGEGEIWYFNRWYWGWAWSNWSDTDPNNCMSADTGHAWHYPEGPADSVGIRLALISEATAITLASFDAKPGNGKVTLNWETATEIDNAGFNILRAESANGAYININDVIIPSKAGATAGATYQFIDSTAKNRTTYYYKLQDVDLDGTTTDHGPKSATPRLIFVFRK